MQTTLTAERLQQLSIALRWDPDRAWLVGARLVEKAPYEALAAQTGRSVGALRETVSLAKRQIEEYEQRQADQYADEEWEEYQLTEGRYAGAIGKALLFWDLTDHHFSLWACVLAFCPWLREDNLLPQEEQWQLMEYKWEADRRYAEGVGPGA